MEIMIIIILLILSAMFRALTQIILFRVPRSWLPELVLNWNISWFSTPEIKRSAEDIAEQKFQKDQECIAEEIAFCQEFHIAGECEYCNDSDYKA